MRGKTVRGTPERVNTELVEKVPRVIPRQESVTLAADVFFVNKVPFLLTLSRKSNFVPWSTYHLGQQNNWVNLWLNYAAYMRELHIM